VLRARIGADYAIGKRVTTGLRLATGSQDNPNTTDVTIGNFNDDLQVSLDLAYLTYASGRVALTGGKFRNPFLKTDMVWDGDVNPQGATGALQLPALAGIPVRAKGMFFVIDEQATGPNSVMEGAQLVTGLIDSPAWKLNVALSYYDYHIGNLLNADAGDIRSNKLTEEGDAYRSDFDLADIIAQVEYDGLGEQWPLRGVAGKPAARGLGRRLLRRRARLRRRVGVGHVLFPRHRTAGRPVQRVGGNARRPHERLG